MIVVKKVDSEKQIVTVLSDDILQEVEFDKFLAIPKVEDIVTIKQSVDGASRYTSVNTAHEEDDELRSNKSKLAAGLLGIFLGGLGIHNFYLGRPGKGVIQLIIGTLGWFLLLGWIASIWGLIEGIVILSSQKGSAWHKDGQGLELQD